MLNVFRILVSSKNKDKEIMNDLQKRKEDLEEAKGWLAIAKENDNKIAIQILEKFFPELRESEDEKIRKSIIAYMRYEQKSTKEEIENKFIPWLEKQREKKSSEWSEEDETVYKRIVSYIPQHLTAESYTANIEWLKSLKDRVQPQPKQEWSEEDEKMLEDTISCLSAYKSPDISKGLCYQEQIDWLKSLKPNHWKPSEQNIKDLEWCADLVKDKMGVGFHRLQVFINEIKNL